MGAGHPVYRRENRRGQGARGREGRGNSRRGLERTASSGSEGRGARSSPRIVFTSTAQLSLTLPVSRLAPSLSVPLTVHLPISLPPPLHFVCLAGASRERNRRASPPPSPRGGVARIARDAVRPRRADDDVGGDDDGSDA